MERKCSCCACPKKGYNLPGEVAFSAVERVPYAADGIVSSAVAQHPAGSVTLFAFDQGQSLSPHSAPFDAVLHVLEGQATITVADEVHSLVAGEMLLMPANVEHAVEAATAFKMVLVMLRVDPEPE